MKHGEIRPSSIVLAADGLIPKLKDCQNTLDQLAKPEQKHEFAVYAMEEILHDPHDIDGYRHVIVRTLGALVLTADDQEKPESEINYGLYTFDEALFVADFDELAYIADYRTLCFGFRNVFIEQSPENPAMEGQLIPSGLYVPAQDMCAAIAA